MPTARSRSFATESPKQSSIHHEDILNQESRKRDSEIEGKAARRKEPSNRKCDKVSCFPDLKICSRRSAAPLASGSFAAGIKAAESQD